jgi:hypothetical protein
MAAMGTKIYAGRAFYLPIPSESCPHIFIALTGAFSYQEETIAIVNLTDANSSRGKDMTTILYPGQHEVIRKETVVNYKDSFIARAAKIQESIIRGESSFRDDFDDVLITKLQEGALRSKQTPNPVKVRIREYLELLS